MTIRTIRRFVVFALVAVAFLAARPWLRIARFACNALLGALIACFVEILIPDFKQPTDAQLLARYMQDQQREMQWADQYTGTFIDNSHASGVDLLALEPQTCLTYGTGKTLCNQGDDMLNCEATADNDPRPICTDAKRADATVACGSSDVDGTALVINCRSER